VKVGARPAGVDGKVEDGEEHSQHIFLRSAELRRGSGS
jgi:hypothetical protein